MLHYGRRRIRSEPDPFDSIETVAEPGPRQAPPELKPLFDEFERRRKPRVIIFGIVSTVTAIGTLAILFLTGNFEATIFTGVGGGGLAYLPLKLLKGDFKDRLVPQILDGYGFLYDRKARQVRVQDYHDILPSYTSMSRSDHFWGAHEGIRMSVSELTLKQKSGKNSSRTVFDGLLCRFDYPKQTTAEVAVRSDGGAVGQFFSGLFVSGERVKLEDPLFESIFDVYSTDQVAARYILTPTVMERLVALEKRHPGVRAIFRDDEVYLTIPGAPDLFDPGSFLSPIDTSIVQQFEMDLESIFKFVDALKLDAETRI